MTINIDGSKGIRQNTTEVTKIPVGTTAQRPANPEAGMIRYNTDTGFVEAYKDDTNEWNKLLRINSNGRVGIGTTSPSQDLHVNDNVYINKNLRMGHSRIQKRGYRFGLANTNNTGVDIPTGIGSCYDILVTYATTINSNNSVLVRKFLVSRPNNPSTGRLDEYATGATSSGNTGSLTASYNTSTGNIEIRKSSGSITTSSQLYIFIEAYSSTGLPDLSRFTF